MPLAVTHVVWRVNVLEKFEPRGVEEEARPRVGEAGGVVPDGVEVVGAGDERPSATERTHAAVA